MTQQEITLINSGDGTSTATAGRKPCILRRVTVRRCGVMITVAGTTTAPVVTFRKRVTPGTNTGATTIGTITAGSATAAAGTAYYLDGLNVTTDLGDELYASVTTAGGGSLALDATVFVEDVPEDPRNASTVTLVTA